ncbi:MAG TPA: c-type cytochrome [Terriglobales bacterium]|nr:c-type cytochrome [Terriglobales bacterium]
MTFLLKRLAAITLLSACAIFARAEADGAWLNKVPAKEHDKANPYRNQAEAQIAGGRIFAEHCAQCHGKQAQGDKKHPSLHSDRVQQQATEGDLHWLLVNGYMSRGMPSWSKLGNPQIWQVITYIKSLH